MKTNVRQISNLPLSECLSLSVNSCSTDEKKPAAAGFSVNVNAYLALRLRAIAKPARPKPNNAKEAGSGTSRGVLLILAEK
jgi:hypothetical protein